jgi:hypothetical protein
VTVLVLVYCLAASISVHAALRRDRPRSSAVDKIMGCSPHSFLRAQKIQFPQRIIVKIEKTAKMPAPDAEDDLKFLPLPEMGRDQRRQTGVNRAGAREDVHCANDSQ